MRTQKWILVLAALSLFGSFAEAGNLEAYKRSFLRTTRIQEGKVAQVDGPDSCQLGRLQVLPIEENESLTLMLGAKPLVTGLGAPAAESTERKCRSKESAEFSAASITSNRSQQCGNKKFEYDIRISLQNDGFEYTRKVTSNGKVVLNEVCKYTYDN